MNVLLATKQFKAAAQARHDNLRQVEEDRDEHRLSGQAAYEARLAGEQAKRDAERVALHDAHLEREEQRWAQIAVLRTLRTEIATERQRLIAAVHAAVELGDLEKAVDAQVRLACLGPVDAIATRRLSALGIEVK